LEYSRSERAATCPDGVALKRAVSKRLGYDPFFPAARQTIVVEITDVDDRLRATMRLVNEQGIIAGARELREGIEHCDELVASLALAISIALDPSAALEATPEPPANTPEVDGPVASGPAAPSGAAPGLATPQVTAAVSPAIRKRQPPVRRREESSLRVAFRGAGVVGFGVGPATALGFRIGSGIGWRSFRIVAEFADQFPTSRETGFEGSVRVSQLGVSVAPCFVWRAFDACAIAQAGALKSEGREIENGSVKRSLSAAMGVRAEYAPLLFGHVHLLLNVDVLKSLTPVTLQLAGRTIWSTPSVSGQGAIGLELIFP
jgi:hypothetical protein